MVNVPLLRDQPVRAVPRRPLPVARHAGDLRAHRAHPPASGVRGLRPLARRRPARAVLRRGLRDAAVLRGRARRARALRGVRSDRGLRRPARVRVRLRAARITSAGRTAAWQPERINLGSGKDYKSGWLNLDLLARAEPDLVLDLARPLSVAATRRRRRSAGAVRLEAGSVSTDQRQQRARARRRPAGADDATAWRCSRRGGEMHVEVPYEGAPTAWQDPTHVRAMNENSWLYYTDWFWYLGWFEHRFAVATSSFLDIKLKPCGREQAAFMRLVLKKVETTAAGADHRAHAAARPAPRPTTRSLPSACTAPRRRPPPPPRRARGWPPEATPMIITPHAVSDLVLRRRHRLPDLVIAARRRGALDHDRQVLLHHLPPPAAVLRAQAPHRLLARSRTSATGTRSSTRRSRAVLEWAQQEQGLEIHHDGDLPARAGIGSSSSFTVGLVHALRGAEGPAGRQGRARQGRDPHRAGPDQRERRLAGPGRGGVRRLQPDRVQALRRLPGRRR